MTDIKTQISAIKKAINHAEDKCKKPLKSVRLLAVSKTQSDHSIRQAFHSGQVCFGENYLQEALTKMNALKDLTIEWHFIGPIQSNKTRDIAQYFDWVQSVDRLKIAQRLADQRPTDKAPLNICIQVNIDNEETKSGVVASEVADLAKQIAQYDNLRLRGLMVIPVKTDNVELQRASFQRAYSLFSQLQVIYPQVDTLSMGMSADMNVAISEGSTMVRIGTALFGARNTTSDKA